MRKRNRNRFITCVICFIAFLPVAAQISRTNPVSLARAPQKHALIIGINEYEKTGGIVPSLAGCANDARSVRQLLISRFGYTASDIDTLINLQATKQNIVAALRRLERKVQPNDQVFFYYAGHGMSFDNSGAQKPGKTSEAILAADISSPERTVIFDWELSAVYNRIIARQGILTVMLDCCNSGNMLMNNLRFGEFEFRELDMEELGRRGRTIAAESIWNTREIDLEMVADEMRSDSSSLLYGEDSISSQLQVLPVLTRSSVFTWDETKNELVMDSAALQKDMRFVPFTGVDLAIRNTVARPHERPNSRLLFMAAAQGDQLARERRNAFGEKHGVFTQAFLDAYDRFPANAPVHQIQSYINTRLKQQFITEGMQLPNYVMDASRKSLPLTGVSALPKQATLLVHSITRNASVLLSYSGMEKIEPGFVLKGQNNPRTRLRVQRKLRDGLFEAMPYNSTLAAAKAEREFLIERRVVLAPAKIVIYWPSSNMNQSQANKVFKAYQPTPSNKSAYKYYPLLFFASHYVWYDGIQIKAGNKEEGMKPATPLSISTMSMRAGRVSQSQDQGGVFVLLPVPAEVLNKAKQLLEGNPNVILTSVPGKASFSIYTAFDEDGKLQVACTDQWLRYIRGGENPKGELTAQELAFPFTAGNINSNAKLVEQSILKLAVRFGWIQ